MEVPKIIQDIYDTFVEYYKEPFVDLQHPTPNRYNILVYWPEVVVTNEQDQSEVIWELYCKLEVYFNGKLVQKMQFLRSEYNEAQWFSGYIHSHISPMYHAPELEEWKDCCTGTGPINHTLAKLEAASYPEGPEGSYANQELYKDMNVWRLFCWELDKYVHVESLAGGPYRRLAHLGSREVPIQLPTISYMPGEIGTIMNTFIPYLAKRNVLKYNYANGKYNLGMSNREALFTISKEFIHWVNTSDDTTLWTHPVQWFKSKGILSSLSLGSFGILRGVHENGNMGSLGDSIGKKLTTFKGKDVVITRNNVESDTKTYLLLNLDALGYIIFKIFNHINTYYGKKSIIEPSVNDSLPSETSSAAYQAAYIF